MAKRYKPLSDDAVSALLDGHIGQSIGNYDSVLKTERQTVLEYFNGTKPAPTHEGNSKYVSHDVYDSVESAKAALLEVFASGYQIGEFEPQGAEDVESCRIASAYVDYVVFRQNNGYKLFSDVIQDGLLARVGIGKVYWDERIEEVEETFKDADEPSLAGLLQAEDVELKEYEISDEGLFSGTIVRRIDKSQVRIEAVPPEEFLIDARAKSIHAATFMAHKTKKSLADLKAEGYDAKKIEAIAASDACEMDTDPEVLARLEKIGADAYADPQQDQLRMVMVYECYVRMDIEGTGKAKLWKVTKAGSEVLDKEEVSDHPFIPFIPLPIPHAFYGSNYAMKVVPIQNARTVLTRGILDHTVTTNNPRVQVVKGTLPNPRELLDRRFGGIVNVTRPDGLLPFPQASLNPFVFQTIQMLDQDKEDVTGVSRLSQGLNKDAISKQNSAAMVEQLATLSMQRQKIIARNFAEGFIKPLWLKVYQLVIENERRSKVIEIAGAWTEVDPQAWAERRDCKITLKLGYGEQEKEAMEFVQMHQFLSSDPSLAPIYTLKHKYNVLKAYCDRKGIRNVNDYLGNPEEAEPAQPDPLMLAEVEVKKAQAENLKANAQVAVVKAQTDAQLDQGKLKLDQEKLQVDAAYKASDAARKDFEAQTRAAVAEQEMAQIAAMPDAQKSGIVSPNG